MADLNIIAQGPGIGTGSAYSPADEDYSDNFSQCERSSQIR